MMNKLLSAVLGVCLLAQSGLAHAQLFGGGGRTTPPPASETQQLVSVLVDETTHAALGSQIAAYADDVSAATGARVLVTPRPASATAHDTAEGLAELYYSGHPESRGTSQLIGVVLIGDVPLPQVTKQGAAAVSIYPYVDFENKAYVPAADDTFVWQGGDDQPEVWHGVISGTTDEVQAQLEQFHAWHQAPPEYAQRTLVFDQPAHKMGLPDALRTMYDNYWKYETQLEDEVWSDADFIDLYASTGGDLTPPTDDQGNALIEGDFSPIDIPQAARGLFAHKFANPYATASNNWLTQLHNAVSDTARWDSLSTDTIVRLVHQRDLEVRTIAGDAQTALETALVDWIRQTDIATQFDLSPVDRGGCGLINNQKRDLYHFGRARLSITEASECSVLLGTSVSPEHPEANLVQALNLFDPSSVTQCASLEEASNGEIKDDPLEGCCAANLVYDEETELVRPHKNLACVAFGGDQNERVGSVSNWKNCVLAPHHEGAEVPVFSRSGMSSVPIIDDVQPGAIGAQGCDPIITHNTNPAVGQVSSLMLHHEPTPQTRAAALLSGGDMPVDSPRGISFYDHGVLPTFQRVDHVDAKTIVRDATLTPEQQLDALAQAMADQQIQLVNIIEAANQTNPVHAQPLPELQTVTIETDAGPVEYEIAAMFADAFADTAERLIAVGDWRTLPLEDKTTRAAQALLGGASDGGFAVATDGYELAVITLQQSEAGAFDWQFEAGDAPTVDDVWQERYDLMRRGFVLPRAQNTPFGAIAADDVFAAESDTDCGDQPFAERVGCFLDSLATGIDFTIISVEGEVFSPSQLDLPVTQLAATPETDVHFVRSLDAIAVAVTANAGVWDEPARVTQTAGPTPNAFATKPQNLKNGKATLQLQPAADVAPGRYVFDVRAGAQLASFAIDLVDAQLTLQPERTVFTAGEQTATNLNLAVLDRRGQLTKSLDGTQLQLATDAGDLASGGAVTVQDGRAVVGFTPGTAAGDFALVAAPVGDDLSPVQTTISVLAATPSQVLFDPAEATFVAGSPVSVTALVTDAFGNVVPRVKDAQGSAQNLTWTATNAELPASAETEFSVRAPASEVIVRWTPTADAMRLQVESSALPNQQFDAQYGVLTNPRLTLDVSEIELTAGGEGMTLGLAVNADVTADLTVAFEPDAGTLSEVITHAPSVLLQGGQATVQISPTTAAGAGDLVFIAPGFADTRLPVRVLPAAEPHAIVIDAAADSLSVGGGLDVQVYAVDRYDNVLPNGEYTIETELAPESVGAWSDTQITSTAAGVVRMSAFVPGANTDMIVPAAAELHVRSSILQTELETYKINAGLTLLQGSPVPELAQQLVANGATQAALTTTNSALGASRQSAEDAHLQASLPWSGPWNPAALWAAGTMAGVAAQHHASDAVVLYGDPTAQLHTPNLSDSELNTVDAGVPIWHAPGGARVAQTESLDLNNDGAVDLIHVVGRNVHAQYGAPNQPLTWRDVGVIAKLPDDAVGQIIKHKSGAFWGWASLSSNGDVTIYDNKNGVITSERTPLFDGVLVDVRPGDLDADGDLDAVLQTDQNAFYVASWANGRFAAPQLLEQLTPQFDPVRETYAPIVNETASVPDTWLPVADALGQYGGFALALALYENQDLAVVRPLADMTPEASTHAVLQDLRGEPYTSKKTTDGWEIPQPVLEDDEAYLTIKNQLPPPDTTDLDALLVPYRFPHLGGMYARFAGLTAGDLHMTVDDVPATFASILTLPWTTDLQLTESANGVSAQLTIMPNSTATDAQFVLPQLGALSFDADSLACVGCAIAVTAEPLGSGQLVRVGDLVAPGIALTWTLTRSASVPTSFSVTENVTAGHDLVLPWTTAGGERVIITHGPGGRTQTLIPELPPQDSAAFGDDFADLSPQDLAAKMQELLMADDDGDGIPTILDSDPATPQLTSDPAAMTDAAMAASDCDKGCDHGLPLPSIAFLAPGMWHLYLPPFSVPLFPTPGLPVVWLPPPPVAPLHMASAFRLYVIPTTALRVGIAACVGPFQGFSAPAILPNCLLLVTPQILFGGQCPAAPDCTASAAQAALGDGPFPTGAVNTSPMSPLHSADALSMPTLSPNRQGGGADPITTWLAHQLRAINAFQVPSVQVLAPSKPEGIEDFLHPKPKQYTIQYPELPPGYALQLERELDKYGVVLAKWLAEFDAQRAELDQDLTAQLQALQGELIRQLQKMKREGFVKESLDIKATVEAYIAQIAAQTQLSYAALDEFRQEIADTQITFRNNIEQVKKWMEYINQLKELPEQLRGLRAALEEMAGAYDEFLTEWNRELGDVMGQWTQYRELIGDLGRIIERFNGVFRSFSMNCGRCEIERGKGSDFLLNLLLGWLKLPVLVPPALPDVVIDLTGVRLGLEYPDPKITLQGVPISGLPLPKLPPVPDIPGPSIPSADIFGDLTQSIIGQLQARGELPSLPDVLQPDLDWTDPQFGGQLQDLLAGIDVPGQIDLLDALGVSEDIGIPSPPPLPELPRLAIPAFDIDVPELRLPELLLPPAPPQLDVPAIFDKLDQFTKILQKFSQFWCFYTSGITPVPEWDLKAATERLTNRTEFFAFDFSPLALTPPHNRPQPAPIVIRPEIDLVVTLDEIEAFMQETQTQWQCAVGALSAAVAGDTGAFECALLPIDLPSVPGIPDMPNLPDVPGVPDIPEIPDLPDGGLPPDLIGQFDVDYDPPAHAFVPQVQTLLASLDTLERAAEQPQLLAPSTNIEPLFAVTKPSAQGLLAQLDAGLGGISLPPAADQTTQLPFAPSGLSQCVGDTSEPVTAQPQVDAVTYFNPEFHISQGSHAAVADSDVCSGGEIARLLISDDTVLLQSCSAQHPSARAPQVDTLPWSDFAGFYAAVGDLTTRSTADAAEAGFDRLSLAIPYFEWIVSERPDMVFEAELNHESSDVWRRLGLLVRVTPRRYEIRPVTTSVVQITGSPQITAPAAVPLVRHSKQACDADPDASVYFNEPSVFVGLADNTRLQIQVPPRPNQPKEELVIRLMAGEETMVERAHVCLTAGAAEHIGTQKLMRIDPRKNLYVPDGTRIVTGAGDSLTFRLFDGSHVRVAPNEEYEVRLFDDARARLAAAMALDAGGYYGLFTALQDDRPGTWWPHVYFDPGPAHDVTPPEVRLRGGTSPQAFIGQVITLDATDTTDPSGIAGVWWDLDPAVDADGDGDPANDADFTPTGDGAAKLRSTLPARDVPEQFDLALTVTDGADNTTTQLLTITVTVPLVQLTEANLRAEILRGRIPEGVSGVPIWFERVRDGQTEILPVRAYTDENGHFELQFDREW